MTKQQKDAMQRGREKAARTARKAAVKRVKDYRAWLKRDVEINKRLRAGEKVKRERMPAIPSDYDYSIAREEAA